MLPKAAEFRKEVRTFMIHLSVICLVLVPSKRVLQIFICVDFGKHMKTLVSLVFL